MITGTLREDIVRIGEKSEKNKAAYPMLQLRDGGHFAELVYLFTAAHSKATVYNIMGNLQKGEAPGVITINKKGRLLVLWL